jgi:hypothetical protein
MNGEQILNGKKIRFGRYSSWIPFSFMRDENYDYIKDMNTIPKDSIKRYMFKYIDNEIKVIKTYAIIDNIKFKSIVDKRMYIWVIFQLCKVVLGWYEIYLNMEDLDEYLTSKKLNLKRKKYSFNY